MRFLFRHKPSPAMAVAILALFVALGGTGAYALQGKNTVDSGDIINQEVKSSDLQNEGVRGGDIRNEDLTGVDVANNSLTGSEIIDDTLGGDDVNESTLGQVPQAASANSAGTAGSAGSADDADKVDGLHARSFNFNVNDPTAKRTLFSLGGLTLKAACGAGDFVTVWVATDTNDSYIRSTVGGGTSNFDTGTDLEIIGSDQDNAGVMSYRRGADPSNGADVVTVTFAYDTNPTGNDCQLSGSAIGG